MFRIISIDNELTCYSINEYGEVINNKTNKKLKGSITRSGYHYYRFSIKNKKYRYYTHRLVAEYFLNFDPNNKHLIINHIDGNKENNFYKNLEICTYSENILHAHKNGLISNRTNIEDVLNLQGEIWRDITDFTGYQVSNFGRVKSLKRKEHILKPSIVNSYKKVSLSKNGTIYNFLVHRLVYQTFYQEDISNYVIDHIDNNPLNNHLDNLQKITNKENILKELRKGQTVKKVIAFKDGIYIGEYYSCAEAARQLGCDSSAVAKVCRGIYRHTHGFTFEYKE